MTTLLVTWETTNPEHVDQVLGFFDHFDCLRLAHNAYAVETDLGADELFGELQERVGTDDLIYVFTLDEPWIGYGYTAMNDWLHRHLRHRKVQPIPPL